MNRRQFLLTTAATSIAFAARAAEPERKWRVAVVGDSSRGKYGHSLDSMWLNVPETEIVAVADADPTGLAGSDSTSRFVQETVRKEPSAQRNFGAPSAPVNVARRRSVADGHG